MLKIWGRATSSNVQKVLWCCGEIGIPFERVDIGGPFGGNQDPEYLALNPNGLVPTVQDGELVLWESEHDLPLSRDYPSGRAAVSGGAGRPRARRAVDGLAAFDPRGADGRTALWADPLQARRS